MRFAFAFGLALLCALGRDFDADGFGHEVFLFVRIRFGLLKLNALIFGLALRVVHVLLLLGENLLGLRLHQLFRQMYMADQNVDDIHVILQKLRAHLCFRALLLFVTILQVGHR